MYGGINMNILNMTYVVIFFLIASMIFTTDTVAVKKYITRFVIGIRISSGIGKDGLCNFLCTRFNASHVFKYCPSGI